LPERAETLMEIARLRVDALRIGITEIVKMRDEIRIAPVSLAASQEVRLARITKRKGVVTGGAVFIPAPVESPAHSLREFLGTMWSPDHG
ncbi:hypothetical protein HQ535_11785, partial [bacterium]|nr:hypothetical protein [bacterium]